jgi:hypothetical protein
MSRDVITRGRRCAHRAGRDRRRNLPSIAWRILRASSFAHASLAS